MNMYVSNLPRAVTEKQVRNLFAPFGTVESVYIVQDEQVGIPKGSAYVVMPSDMQAEQAIAALNGSEYDGKTLQVVSADSADFPTGDYW